MISSYDVIILLEWPRLFEANTQPTITIAMELFQLDAAVMGNYMDMMFSNGNTYNFEILARENDNYKKFPLRKRQTTLRSGQKRISDSTAYVTVWNKTFII